MLFSQGRGLLLLFSFLTSYYQAPPPLRPALRAEALNVYWVCLYLNFYGLSAFSIPFHCLLLLQRISLHIVILVRIVKLKYIISIIFNICEYEIKRGRNV